MKRILASQLRSWRTKGRAQEFTVGRGGDPVESFGLCTNMFAALTELHTDIAAKAFILSGIWAAGGDPLETNALVSDIGVGY